jgi:hypothetical protein
MMNLQRRHTFYWIPIGFGEQHISNIARWPHAHKTILGPAVWRVPAFNPRIQELFRNSTGSDRAQAASHKGVLVLQESMQHRALRVKYVAPRAG